MKIKHVNHIGITVNDLEAASEFFLALGFKPMGQMAMEGELVDRVTGLKGVKSDMTMLESPDGQLNLEFSKFHHPVDPEGVKPKMVNGLGLRHLALEVENIEEIIAMLDEKGYKLVGELQNYEGSWKLCYINGPEGIIVELAEQLS
jgi:catechol 2,3-dioxygenase-like lactoylglutathione lyase family enzyme